MKNIVLELTPAQFNIVQEAMNELHQSYEGDEWSEVGQDWLADYNAASRVIEDAARKHSGSR